MGRAAPVEVLLRRDRAVVIAALSLILVVSWAYVLSGAGMGMPAADMSSLSMALGAGEPAPMSGAMSGLTAALATPSVWTPAHAALMVLMWWVMMVAMMLPSAAPMILLHAVVQRRTMERTGERAGERAGKSGGPWATAAFTLGYLLTWAVFSVIATALQWRLEGTGLLSPMTLNSTSAALAGSILVFAGAYQLTPIKRACLKHCRGPISFLSRHWRPGVGGALAMGIRHGAYCLGCCWGLMAILFFGGIMNLYWIIGLAAIVLVEKLARAGARVSAGLGALLLAWGLSVLYGAFA